MPAQTQRALVAAGDIQARFSGAGFFQPRWTGHALLGAEDYRSREPLFYAIDKDGNREEFRFTLPDADLYGILGLAGGFDGAIAAIGGAYGNDSAFFEFVAWISPDRKRQTVVRLAPYFPAAVAIASDNTIWLAGTVHGDGPSYPAHDVMRRYDSTGKMLGSFLPWEILKRGNRGHPAPGSFMVASGDRVGLYTKAPEYIEIALDGKLLSRFNGLPLAKGQRITGIGLNEEYDLLISREDPIGLKSEVLGLDRGRRAWTIVKKADGVFPRGTRVLGFDNGELLATDSAVIRRYAPATSPPSGPAR